MKKSFLLILALIIVLPITASTYEKPPVSCDTWVAIHDATAGDATILGKNSDRPIYDCQPLLLHKGKEYPEGATLKLEYREIPQVKETYTTLGSSPYWCWGYEEGINEHGVTIGNEAIFTKTFKEAAKAYKEGNGPELGLLGMDLLRLGLERGKTAREALMVITELVEKYGQFGSGVPTADHPSGGYDNSYIIADSREAWILETCGKRWVAKKVSSGVSSISNQPTIRTEWDKACDDLVEYALDKGWWPEDMKESFDFAWAYIDPETPRHLSHCRMMITRKLLKEREGTVDVPWMMRIARDHYEDTFLEGPYFAAAAPDFLTIDMYSSPAGFTWGNTASSCVSVMPTDKDGIPVFWWAPTPPGNSCYVPFFVHGSELPDVVSRAGTFGKRVVPPNEATKDKFSADSYWWLMRDLLDKTRGKPVGVKPGYWAKRHPIVRKRFDALEKKFREGLPEVVEKAKALRKEGRIDKAAEVLDAYTARCVKEVVSTVNELRRKFK